MISKCNNSAVPLPPVNIPESCSRQLWRREGRFLMLDVFIDTTLAPRW